MCDFTAYTVMLAYDYIGYAAHVYSKIFYYKDLNEFMCWIIDVVFYEHNCTSTLYGRYYLRRTASYSPLTVDRC